MATHVLRFGNTTTGAITASAAVAFTNNSDKQIEVRYVADRIGFVSVVGTADDQEAYVPADCIEYLQIDPGKSLSVIKLAAETDGNFWVTEIQRV